MGKSSSLKKLHKGGDVPGGPVADSVLEMPELNPWSGN